MAMDSSTSSEPLPLISHSRSRLFFHVGQREEPLDRSHFLWLHN